MKSKIILCLALVLSGGVFGCSTAKPPLTVDYPDLEHIKLPIKFASYREFFTFAGHSEMIGQPLNDDVIFKLAADSTIKIVRLDLKPMPYVFVVETHYFRDIYIDDERGTQNNGLFYVLRPLTNDHAGLGGFELIGILEANGYTVQYANGTPQFSCGWHNTFDDNPESIYEWNGKYFELKK